MIVSGSGNSVSDPYVIQQQIQLKPANKDELAFFCEMAKQDHARDFVNQHDLETLQTWFARDNTHFLCICDTSDELIGYFILIVEQDEQTVEFARIVIDRRSRGIGQLAIREMEAFCRNELGANRIWLDVYEDNPRGIHIYEKLGYSYFKTEMVADRKLHFYEKYF
ncbi:MAG: GNAT family N-acetyltransferase [Pseudomonadota bacterium]